MSCPQLHELLPDILDEHTLKYHWAHAFDPTQNPVGIHAHVDEAAVNFNFWVRLLLLSILSCCPVLSERRNLGSQNLDSR